MSIFDFISESIYAISSFTFIVSFGSSSSMSNINIFIHYPLMILVIMTLQVKKQFITGFGTPITTTFTLTKP